MLNIVGFIQNLYNEVKTRVFMETKIVSKKFVHQFYFVKFWPHEDPNVKAKIEEAEKLIKRINQEGYSIAEKYREKMEYEKHVKSQLYPLQYLETDIREALAYITQTLNHLRDKCNMNSEPPLQAMMLHRTKNLATEKKLLREISKNSQRELGVPHGLLSAEKDFRNSIKRFCQRMRGPRYDKVRDKQFLNNIKELEKVEKRSNLGSERAIQDQTRLINKISDVLKKESYDIRTKIKSLKKDLNGLENDGLTEQYEDIQRREREVYAYIRSLRDSRDTAGSRYEYYDSVLRYARGNLARKKDLVALQRLSLTEIKLFMYEWNTSKAFRNDYESRMLPSLDSRQLSRDGRMRNFGEQDLLSGD